MQCVRTKCEAAVGYNYVNNYRFTTTKLTVAGRAEKDRNAKVKKSGGGREKQGKKKEREREKREIKPRL